MAKQKRITVWGKARRDIDPLLFVHVLVAIAEEQEQTVVASSSPDAYDAAIEDLTESPQ